MSSPVISDELKKSLRSVLLSKAGGVELHRIPADYMKFVGRPLLYQQYGFRNVHSFLQALPDVARIIEQPSGVAMVMAVDADHSLAHINPTARRALYHPGNDTSATVNGELKPASKTSVKTAQSDAATVFVGNFPLDMPEASVRSQLDQLLTGYKVLNLRVTVEPGVKSFAHVDTTAEDARRMCSELRGKKVESRNLVVEPSRSNSQSAGNRLSAEASVSRAEQKPTRPVYGEQSSAPQHPPGSQHPPVSQHPPGRLESRNVQSLLDVSVAAPIRSPSHTSSIDSVSLDDPAIVLSLSPGGRQDNQSVNRDNRRPGVDSLTQDRWRPTYGKMDGGGRRNELAAVMRGTKVHLMGLPSDITESELMDVIQQKNLSCINVRIHRLAHNQVEAFAQFHTLEDAIKCLGTTLCVRNCQVTSKMAEAMSVSADAEGWREVKLPDDRSNPQWNHLGPVQTPGSASKSVCASSPPAAGAGNPQDESGHAPQSPLQVNASEAGQKSRTVNFSTQQHTSSVTSQQYPQQKRRSEPTQHMTKHPPSRCLFIVNLSPAITETALTKFAESYGRVDYSKVVRERETQQSKGFGFIYMQTIDDAVNLRNNNMDAVMDGRTVRIEFADDRGFGDKHAGSDAASFHPKPAADNSVYPLPAEPTGQAGGDAMRPAYVSRQGMQQAENPAGNTSRPASMSSTVSRQGMQQAENPAGNTSRQVSTPSTVSRQGMQQRDSVSTPAGNTSRPVSTPSTVSRQGMQQPDSVSTPAGNTSRQVSTSSTVSRQGMQQPDSVSTPAGNISRPVSTSSTVSVSARADSQIPSQSAPLQRADVSSATAGQIAEIPAAMEEGVMSWMYDECCPGRRCVTADDLPTQVTFILMYVDPDDSQFFWSAVLHDHMTTEMAETLQSLYELPEDLPALTTANKRRAGFNLDGEWMRVWVCGMAGKMVSVHYIDYGNEDSVLWTALRQLPDVCWQHRPIAVPCHASSFSPDHPQLKSEFAECLNQRFTATVRRGHSTGRAVIELDNICPE